MKTSSVLEIGQIIQEVAEDLELPFLIFVRLEETAALKLRSPASTAFFPETGMHCENPQDHSSTEM